MSQKQTARVAYYQGAEEALEQHLQKTESGLKKLKGLDADKIDKLVKSVRKDHDKLMAKIKQRAMKQAS